MMAEAHKIAPQRAFLAVCFFGCENAIREHVEAAAIDGVIFPYSYPHNNLSDALKSRPPIEAWRRWLNEHTTKAGLIGELPLVVTVCAEKHSESPDSPIPACVKDCLEIGLQSTADGLADGVVTSCLPKDDPLFENIVALSYSGRNNTERK